ncbi:MAG: hypothetical protein JW834_00280 [Candidatus Diapherotrites archaeon]|nr:hypothetical protein [Candidatus Diapherotrites archaeon]
MPKKTLLEKATQVLKQEPDLIVDLYDLTVKYVSDRHLAFTDHTRGEIVGGYGKNFIDFMSQEKIDKTLKDLIIFGHGIIRVNVNNRSGGKVVEELDARFFMYGLTPYTAIKTRKLAEIPG